MDDKRVKPAGLGSRDVLRLEMGYSLYGQDIDETVTPLEAGLERYVDFNKDFIGKQALLEQKRSGTPRTRVFFRTLSRRSPRHNHAIYVENTKAGVVTSGSFSPMLECGIGMGLMETKSASAVKFCVGDDNLKIEAAADDRPFLKKTSLKN